MRSRISLCLMDGKPPLAHESACSTLKFLPQSHLDGRFDGDHPYRRAIASWKAALCSEKPCSLRGRAVSQVEAPFSLASSTAFCSWSGNWLCRSSASLELISLICLLMVALLCSWSAMMYNVFYINDPIYTIERVYTRAYTCICACACIRVSLHLFTCINANAVFYVHSRACVCVRVFARS